MQVLPVLLGPPDPRARREKPVPWALLVLQEQMEPREILEPLDPPDQLDQRAQMVTPDLRGQLERKEFKAPQGQPERKATPVMLALLDRRARPD